MKNILKIITNRLIIVGLALLLQLTWVIISIYKVSAYSNAVGILMVVLGVVVVMRIVSKNDNPAYKLAWSTLILAVPVFGVTLYLLFGRKNAQKSMRVKGDRIHKILQPELTQDAEIFDRLLDADSSVAKQSRYISSSTGFPVYQNTTAEYLPIGEVYFEALKRELLAAKHFIFMEYFIVECGEMWDSILDILIQKAKEGVEVRFMYDDMGCIMILPSRYEEKLKSYGIETRVFNPFVPFLSMVMNNRDHRKIAVIDGHTGFTGGINLADEYINAKAVHGHWKDTGIMLKGEGVWSLTAMFLEMWNTVKATDTDFIKYRPIRPEGAAFATDGFIQPYGDSPLDTECVGESVYLNIINRAKRYVYIYTPYLITDNEMVTALTLAAKSGVDVRIVTPHIPDKKFVFLLTRSYYPQLLKAGVRIMEYTPGFIHAKCFLCDDELGTVGTINMDYRSLYLHFECGVLLYRCRALEQMKKDFMETFDASIEITNEFCDATPWYTRAMQVVLKLFAPLF